MQHQAPAQTRNSLAETRLWQSRVERFLNILIDCNCKIIPRQRSMQAIGVIVPRQYWYSPFATAKPHEKSKYHEM
jgi:hypothetical protein